MVVSCEVVKPYADRPTEGFFKFNASFSPMASPAFGGRVSSQGIEIGRVVERGLRESGAIDTEALCIVAGEKVWAVRLDMHVLDDHGNLMDCCSIGAITALHHFRRPDVTISGGMVEIHSAHERAPVPLSIHHMPISVSFALFGAGTMIVDPLWKEERVCNGRMTITLNAQHEVCAMQKAGGVALTAEQLIQATQVAQVKVVELSAAIDNALKADKATRKYGSISASELMTSGIGLEELVQDEIEAMDIDSSTGPNAKELGKRGLRFFQGMESLDLPDIDNEDDGDEYDNEYIEIDDSASESEKKPTTKTSAPAKASTTQNSDASAASPKKGPIVKGKSASVKPIDAVKALTQKAKASPTPSPSPAAKPKASSSSMDVDSKTSGSKPAGEDTRAKINKQEFDSFVARVTNRVSASNSKPTVKKRKSAADAYESDDE